MTASVLIPLDFSPSQKHMMEIDREEGTITVKNRQGITAGVFRAQPGEYIRSAGFIDDRYIHLIITPSRHEEPGVTLIVWDFTLERVIHDTILEQHILCGCFGPSNGHLLFATYAPPLSKQQQVLHYRLLGFGLASGELIAVHEGQNPYVAAEFQIGQPNVVNFTMRVKSTCCFGLFTKHHDEDDSVNLEIKTGIG